MNATRSGIGGPLRALVALAVLGVACTATRGGSGTRSAGPGAIRTETVPAPAGANASSGAGGQPWSDSVLAHLSLRDKAAQLVWPWILGDYVPAGSAEWARLEQLVREQHVGGFIVSVGSPIEIAAKINALQRMSDRPLLISADFETGAGFRARGGYFVPNAIDLGGATNFPLQMALGAARDSGLAYEFGRVTAIEGRALGVHIAFGPVLDVNNNPANPVIGARSIGEEPQLVARLGAAVVRGIEEHGMLATGKHFPGHGDTETNSHLVLSTVTASRARLDSVELVPFRAAIAAGLGAMMTYHGIIPALDGSGVPATLSASILNNVLRHELRFDGLIITDAMDMAGVTQQFGALEAVKRAVAAGADVLLMPPDIGGSIDAVVAGVREGRYSEARLDSSVRRLLVLKHRFGLDRDRLVSIDNVRAIVGDSANVAVARQLAERGLTLVKDSLGLVPVAARRGRVLAITIAPRADLAAGTTFTATLRRAFPQLRSELLLPDVEPTAPSVARLAAAADSADVVIVASYVIQTSATATAGAPPAVTQLVAELMRRGRGPIVVAFGNPYLLREIAAAPAYLVAWGGSIVSQQAAARALMGEIAITGRLPISIPPVVPIGAGLVRASGGMTAPRR